VSAGLAWSITATTPETSGAAEEVCEKRNAYFPVHLSPPAWGDVGVQPAVSLHELDGVPPGGRQADARKLSVVQMRSTYCVAPSPLDFSAPLVVVRIGRHPRRRPCGHPRRHDAATGHPLPSADAMAPVLCSVHDSPR
jgi:hypothetical protein